MKTDNKQKISDPEKVPHDHHDIERVSVSSADTEAFSDAFSSGSGEIDMRIARDGTWFYLGTPINRKPLVKLFSTVLRLEEDGEYYLVTPVEKARISVDDAPFTAVEMMVEGKGDGQKLTFRTNVDDMVSADSEHPLRLAIDDETGEPSPYIRVRDNLEALVVRSVFYDLVELARDAGDGMLAVWSGGTCFELGTGNDDKKSEIAE